MSNATVSRRYTLFVYGPRGALRQQKNITKDVLAQARAEGLEPDEYATNLWQLLAEKHTGCTVDITGIGRDL